MRKKIPIVTSLILFSLTAFWHFGLVPRLTQRVPAGWTWKADFIGINAYPDPQTGKLPDKDSTSIYQRRMYVASEADRPRSVMLEDTNVSLEPTTGKKIWEYIYRAQLDPQTGAHLQPEYLGDYYLFPRFVEKKTYKFRNNYIKGVPLSFQHEEEIEGVQTYLFSYRGYGEYTESYVGTAETPGVKVEPGQEIRCDDDQFIINAWVEPVTGEILRLEEGCSAGDSFYDKATGQRLGAVDRWAGKTAGDDDIQRAEMISRGRSKLLWITRYIPLTMLLAGVLCFGLAFVPGRVSNHEDEKA